MVVQTTQPGYPTGPPVGYTATGQPVYAAPPVVYGGVAPPGAYPPAGPPPGATTTVVYSHTSSHSAHSAHNAHSAQSAVVTTNSEDAAKAKGKKRRLACVAVCLFIAALVLCLTLVPLPFTRTAELLPNQQDIVTANGLFIESTEITTDGAYQPVQVTYLSSYPVWGSFVSASVSKNIGVPVAGDRSYELHTYLNYGANVYIDVSNGGGCSLFLYVFRGQSRYDDFVNYGTVNTYVGIVSFTGNLDNPGISIYNDDSYYFVVYNAGTSGCNSSVSLSYQFDTRKYLTTGSENEVVGACTSGNCVDNVPYGENRVYLLEVPYNSLPSNTYRTQISLVGNTGAYVGLYVGVFGSYFCCCALFFFVSARKSRASDAESDPLMSHVQNQTHEYAPPPPVATAPPPSYGTVVANDAGASVYQTSYPVTQAPYQVTQAPYPVK